MHTIHLDANQVPATLRGNYSGKKFKVKVCTTMTVPADAGLWSGGSREHFRGVNIETGQAQPFPGQELSPWDDRGSRKVDLIPGFAVVEHSIFQGADMGLTFYIHPDNATKLLPASVELSPVERMLLIATRSLKSSYNGRDRYAMAADEYSCKQALQGQPFPTRAQWDEAKAALIGRGMLNKAGAITTAGRNAAQ